MSMDGVEFAGNPLGGGFGRAESKVEFDTTAVCDPNRVISPSNKFHADTHETCRRLFKNRPFTYDISRNIALHRTEVLIPYY